MLNDDCMLSSAQLLEFRARMQHLGEDLAGLRDDIAVIESQTPYHRPGPFCGYVAQARNALTLSVDAVNELLLGRDSAEAAAAVYPSSSIQQKVPSTSA